jgi:hypothetical protein
MTTQSRSTKDRFGYALQTVRELVAQATPERFPALGLDQVIASQGLGPRRSAQLRWYAQGFVDARGLADTRRVV